jgi:hypothetical protein
MVSFMSIKGTARNNLSIGYSIFVTSQSYFLALTHIATPQNSPPAPLSEKSH